MFKTLPFLTTSLIILLSFNSAAAKKGAPMTAEDANKARSHSHDLRKSAIDLNSLVEHFKT